MSEPQEWRNSTWPGSADPVEAFRQTLERTTHVNTCEALTHSQPYQMWPCRIPTAEAERLIDAARAAAPEPTPGLQYDRLDALAAAAHNDGPFCQGCADQYKAAQDEFGHPVPYSYAKGHAVAMDHCETIHGPATIRDLVAAARERDELRAAAEAVCALLDEEPRPGRAASFSSSLDALRAALAASPAVEPRPCARYFGSDGTLCSTHNGRFASELFARCDRWDASPEPTPGLREAINAIATEMIPHGTTAQAYRKAVLRRLDAALAASPAPERPYPEPAIGDEAFDAMIADGLAEPLPAPEPTGLDAERLARVLMEIAPLRYSDSWPNDDPENVGPFAIEEARQIIARLKEPTE